MGRGGNHDDSLNHQDARRLYNTLAVLAWLLDVISPDSLWKQRLRALLRSHAIDPSRMGFPQGWERWALWDDGHAQIPPDGPGGIRVIDG